MGRRPRIPGGLGRGEILLLRLQEALDLLSTISCVDDVQLACPFLWKDRENQPGTWSGRNPRTTNLHEGYAGGFKLSRRNSILVSRCSWLCQLPRLTVAVCVHMCLFAASQ